MLKYLNSNLQWLLAQENYQKLINYYKLLLFPKEVPELLVFHVVKELNNENRWRMPAVHELAREMDDGEGMAKPLSNAKDSGGRGVIHAAAEKGRINICKYLIEELKFDVDEKDGEDCTPLLRATFEGRVRTVVYLIESGANPATLNRHNATALHIAASEAKSCC